MNDEQPLQLSADELLADSGIEALPEELRTVCRHGLAISGKQLRPNLVLEAARCGPHPEAPEVRRAAIAMELVHVATLTHDDVMDSASLRRGTESLPSRFGNRAAIFGGVWFFGRTVELLTECGTAAVSRLATAVPAICDGQMLEIRDLFNVDRTPERYYEAIEGKTAALLELCTALGAELAGAEPGKVSSLSAYGRELGLAFQLSDDLLDLVAGDEVLGKTAGNDLRHGVYTLPVIYALQTEPELADTLSRTLDEEELEDVVKAIVRTGGVDRALEDCRRHSEAAQRLSTSHDAAPFLHTAAQYVYARCQDAAAEVPA
jgi:heptaprenyl diphosphate synthase